MYSVINSTASSAHNTTKAAGIQVNVYIQWWAYYNQLNFL